MRTDSALRAIIVPTLALVLLAPAAPAKDLEQIAGERLDPSDYGPAYIESWDEVLVRARFAPPRDLQGPDSHAGEWIVPSKRKSSFPHSGLHYAINKWGDTQMGIGFPEVVDVHGAFFAGQAGTGVWTTGVRAIGFRDGQQIAETDWFTDIGSTPKWFAMDLRGVDRILIESLPVVNGAGWYGMDDLTFAPHDSTGTEGDDVTVVDFEDLGYRTVLTGTTHAGLTWEAGQRAYGPPEAIHPPYKPVRDLQPPVPTSPPLRADTPLRDATLPTLDRNWNALGMTNAFPPDTIGAAGLDHYVVTVNRNIAVYTKGGWRWSNVDFDTWMPGAQGDPRVIFDPDSQRFFVTISGFQNGYIYLAVSTTSNPRDPWFKTSFNTSVGSDYGSWSDYPTLGVDENGVYVAAYMIPRGTMTIHAIDKAPLIAATPSLGAVTSFRNQFAEGAIQPALTYGSTDGEYLISRVSPTYLTVRRVNPPITSPTLSVVGYLQIPEHSDPPSAPAMGSTTPLDTTGPRAMMGVYRDGSLWTCHAIGINGRCGCRWYEVDPATVSLVQYGTVSDSSLYYYYPSLMVNSRRDVVMGFSGSNGSQFVSAYYTGRRGTDTPGSMAPPALVRLGIGPQNHIDPYGFNRWGDYSYTSLDPTDDLVFWTLQAYGDSGNDWRTYAAELYFEPDENCPGDMDCDGQITFDDINRFVEAMGTPGGAGWPYPDCPWLNGDCNGDSDVTFDDINPFVALIGTSCP